MNEMFKCENGTQFSLEDCIMVSVLRPIAAQQLFEDEDETYYAKVYITDRRKTPLFSCSIIRKDYDRLSEMKELFKCENGDMFSLDVCISKSVLRPGVVQQHLKEEGITFYAELYITDVAKSFLVRQKITRKDYDRLSEVYIDPISGNHI